MHEQRLARLRSLLQQAGLDYLALVPGPSLTYFSGLHVHLSERPFLLLLTGNPEESAALTPLLEAAKVEAAGVPAERIMVWRDEEGYAAAFQTLARQLQLSQARLGVEALKMRVLELHALQNAALTAQLVHADGITAHLRRSKGAEEIACLQHAAQVAEAALTACLPRLHLGQTERQIAAMMVQALLEAGADGPAFDVIAAAGPTSALPHAVPTDRPIQTGDLLILDWGARVGDYVSDITRTFAVGTITPELRHVYETVQHANAQGVAAATLGATGQSIDRAARGVIQAAGLGRYFIHRTGHGLGMEAHEPPSLMEGQTDPLPVGAVFTVEPGIYLPNVGGVRIEDNVALTPDGPLCLTTLPRDLIQVG